MAYHNVTYYEIQIHMCFLKIGNLFIRVCCKGFQSFCGTKFKNGFEKSKNFRTHLSFSSDTLQSIKRQRMDQCSDLIICKGFVKKGK